VSQCTSPPRRYAELPAKPYVPLGRARRHSPGDVLCARSVRAFCAPRDGLGSAVMARTSASRKVTSDSAPITNRRRFPRRSLEPAANTARVAGRGEGEGLRRAASSVGGVRIRVGRRRGGRVPQGDDRSLACEPPPRPPRESSVTRRALARRSDLVDLVGSRRCRVSPRRPTRRCCRMASSDGVTAARLGRPGGVTQPSHGSISSLRRGRVGAAATLAVRRLVGPSADPQ
jgi:hypothetical protein